MDEKIKNELLEKYDELMRVWNEFLEIPCYGRCSECPVEGSKILPCEID